jgi:ribosome-associated protein
MRRSSVHPRESVSSTQDAPPGAEPAQRPSKTQLKQQMHELQRLGQLLVDLSPAQLQRIELPERLRDQIDLARRVTAREALRRQVQYIGRLMREADVEAIRARLAIITGQSEAAVGLMHRCERLREQLLSDDQALTEFVSNHREVDAQWLHGKIRAARRERDDGSAPRNLRELYRWLHQQLQQPESPA